MLVTGDVADRGLPGEYEQARSLLTGPWPVLICPGTTTSGPRSAACCSVARAIYPSTRSTGWPVAVFVLCDSTIPAHDDGYLADETLAWLDTELGADPATPAFVVLHHQPVLPAHRDQRRDPAVRRGPAGCRDRAASPGGSHAVRARAQRGGDHVRGPAAAAAPGVVCTSALPWEERDSADLTAPPAVAYHVLGDDGRLITHYRPVVLR